MIAVAPLSGLLRQTSQSLSGPRPTIELQPASKGPRRLKPPGQPQPQPPTLKGGTHAGSHRRPGGRYACPRPRRLIRLEGAGPPPAPFRATIGFAVTAKECRAFLDKCDELVFRDPKAGREHAAEGLARVEELANPPELHARALTLVAGSLRPSDPHQALAFADRSIAIYREHGATTKPSRQMLRDEADARRKASLIHRDLAALGHHDHRYQAFDEADRAYKIYAALRDSEGAAQCQLARATIHFRLGEYLQGLRLLLPALPELRGIHSIAAAHNVKTALVWARRRGIAIPEDLRRLALTRSIRLVRLAPSSRERWADRPPGGSHGRRKKTPEDALWRWNLAIFLVEDRRYHDALQVYTTARDDLAALGMPLYVAEITLDMAPLHARFGMWDKVRRVAAEDCQILGELPKSAQAVAAYGLWAQAIEAEDHEHLAELTEACCTALGQLRNAA